MGLLDLAWPEGPDSGTCIRSQRIAGAIDKTRTGGHAFNGYACQRFGTIAVYEPCREAGKTKCAVFIGRE